MYTAFKSNVHLYIVYDKCIRNVNEFTVNIVNAYSVYNDIKRVYKTKYTMYTRYVYKEADINRHLALIVVIPGVGLNLS